MYPTAAAAAAACSIALRVPVVYKAATQRQCTAYPFPIYVYVRNIKSRVCYERKGERERGGTLLVHPVLTFHALLTTGINEIRVIINNTKEGSRSKLEGASGIVKPSCICIL